MENYRKQCADKGLPTDDETVVLFAMFPQQVEALYKKTPAAGPATPTAPTPVTPAAAPTPASSAALSARLPNGAAHRMFITVNGKRHSVTVETLEG
jgi:hypothetical protein